MVMVIFYVVLKGSIILKLVFNKVRRGYSMLLIVIPRFNISHGPIVSKSLLIFIILCLSFFPAFYNLLLANLWTIGSLWTINL